MGVINVPKRKRDIFAEQKWSQAEAHRPEASHCSTDDPLIMNRYWRCRGPALSHNFYSPIVHLQIREE